jgi:O-succinylbenzoate synthase
MKIEAIVARELSMQLIAPFETSFGVTDHRRILLLQLITDSGEGWGEFTAGEGPFYNPETTDTGWVILEKFLAPMVLGREFASIDELSQAMAPVRGHEMAKAAIETAAWHAAAAAAGVPLATLLGGTRTTIASGVSLGIFRDDGALLERVETALAAGYQRIKLKIKPGRDVSTVAAVRKRYPEIDLTVDANSAYTLDDLHLLRQLDDFGLAYIEQPLAWNDIYRHSLLQKQMKTALCLDECIHALADAQTAIELNACRVINIKLGRVGGHGEARRIQQYCLERGVPVWCGGMLESGVGRMHNIAMSSLPGFVYPGDVSASGRYWHQDIIDPPVTVGPDGTITVPATPGLGAVIATERIEKLTVRRATWKPA